MSWQVEAVNLWTSYRRGELPFSEMDRRLVLLEQAHGIYVTLCERCHERHATIRDQGLLCATCRNVPPVPVCPWCDFRILWPQEAVTVNGGLWHAGCAEEREADAYESFLSIPEGS